MLIKTPEALLLFMLLLLFENGDTNNGGKELKNTFLNHGILRPKRSWGPRNKACELLIAIDEPLYKKYDSNIANLTSLVKTYVKDMNDIYARTLLKSDGPFKNIYFRIKEIRILFDFCTQCNSTQIVFLNQFSKMNFHQFCLAHVFTYRDFPEGIQGLAWKSTICKGRYNTGFTTLLNHQVEATIKDSVMTFTHEIGHNLGSDHDEEAGCSSNHIMSESGTTRSNPTFSKCSLNSMRAELNNVLKNPHRDCFVDKAQDDKDDFSFCGDGIVSGYEECDCGMDYRTCSDPCCYAAHIDPWDLYYNSSATPCRRTSRDSCLHPYKSIWIYGFIGPWIFLALMILGLTVLLVWDWKHSQMFYKHVTEPKQLIRSETAEQIMNRQKRSSFRHHSNKSRPDLVQQVYTVSETVTDPSSPPTAEYDDVVQAIKLKFQQQ